MTLNKYSQSDLQSVDLKIEQDLIKENNSKKFENKIILRNI